MVFLSIILHSFMSSFRMWNSFIAANTSLSNYYVQQNDALIQLKMFRSAIYHYLMGFFGMLKWSIAWYSSSLVILDSFHLKLLLCHYLNAFPYSGLPFIQHNLKISVKFQLRRMNLKNFKNIYPPLIKNVKIILRIILFLHRDFHTFHTSWFMERIFFQQFIS